MESNATAQSQTGRRGWLSLLLSFRGVVVFWIVYGIAHALLRLSISRTLTLDDSRASELAQTLSPGYQVRQPPLYEWLLWGSQQLLGAGIESHLLVRYSLIAALGIATFGAVRAATASEGWAAAASLSLVFSYPVGWTFHEWATQTILLCIACMATMHAAIRFLDRPNWPRTIWLGLAMTLGCYAKFSYPLFLAALLLAALSLPEARRRLFDARLLVSAAIAILALFPYALWVLQVNGNIAAEISAHLIQEPVSHFRRALIGLGRLAISMPLFLLPWLLFVALLAPPAFLRQVGETAAAGNAEKLSLRTMLFAALLAAVGIAALGATNIAERYMHPILIVAPVYVFARVRRIADRPEMVRNAGLFAAGAAIFLFVFRFAAATDNPLTQNLSRGLLAPYAGLAELLKARGITEGTVLTVRVREAGNLRAFNPDLRVIAKDSLRPMPPPRRPADNRSCVLLWAERQEREAASIAPLGGLQIERLDVEASASVIFGTRPGTWFMARLEPGSPACR